MVRTYLVSIKTLEQIHHFLEEITHFLLRLIVAVAAWVNCVQTSTVLAPFMLPERLVVSVDVHPVLVHVVDEIGTALRVENGRDVGVGTVGVTIGLVGAITVVGPDLEISINSLLKRRCARAVSTYHSPWIVHESVGPVGGFVSQN